MPDETTLEWVRKAETDYQGARDLARRRNNPLPDLVCWLCQQCIEKYIKAFLTRHHVAFFRTHNLTGLLRLCLDIDPDFRLIADSLQFLNPFGPEIRYPGASATQPDARLAVTPMNQARKFLRAKLGIR
jgi:HEPN domain-containing protein